MHGYFQQLSLYGLPKLLCILIILFSGFTQADSSGGNSASGNSASGNSASGNSTGRNSHWVSDWEHERSENGIDAQCRTHTSNIKQCKFKTESSLPVESLSAVIMDVSRFKEWAVSVIESDQIIYDESDSDTYVYTVYQFTGAYNRDALTRYRKREFPHLNRTNIDFITVDKPVEKKDLRLVRFPLMAGYWQFTKKENGKTEIELLTFSLPGGMVQNVLYSLFNMGSLDASFETMIAIQKQASLPEYLARATK